MAERPRRKEEDWVTWAAIVGGLGALGALTWYYLIGGIVKVTKSKIISVTAPSSAAPGQQVQVKVKLGIVDTEGRMWGQIVDKSTGQVVGQKQTSGSVKEAEQTWTLTMPSSTWSLRAESSAVR